jgi:very-short-patch-repair endonuclease
LRRGAWAGDTVRRGERLQGGGWLPGSGRDDHVVEDVPWSVINRDPLSALIDAQEGVIARWQARQFLTSKAIEHRIVSSRWCRVHRGVYVAYGGPLTLAQRLWIAVLAASQGPSLVDDPVCLAGVSALLVHGLRSITARQIDLVVPVSRRIVAPAGVVVHRSVEIDRHPASRLPTTTIGRAVVDAAVWARSDDEARLIIAAAFQQRLVTADEIQPILDRRPTMPRHRLIAATVNDASRGSHTLGELDLVKLCRRAKLPEPTRQLRFRDRRGRLRFLDAVFDPWKVAVEIDGAHHDDVGQRWDDCDRDNALILATYTILRYPTYVVREQPERVAEEIRMALTNAGWRPQRKARD